MKYSGLFFFVFFFVGFFSFCEAWDRGSVKEITLSSGWFQPESITTDGKGRIYATLYQPTSEGVGRVLEIRGSKVVKVHKLPGTTRGLAGIHYNNKKDGSILVIDNVGAKIVKWVPSSGKVTDYATIPDVSGGSLFPNDLTQNKNGDVFVTDSLQGVIFKITDDGATVDVWSSASVLGNAAGLAANGLGFFDDEKTLLVTSTAGQAIYAFPVTDPQNPTLWANNYGPDGLRVSKDGKSVWVASNSGCEVVVYNTKGKAIAVKGDFDGIDSKGVARGLFGPSGLVYDDDTGKWYVVNAGLAGLGLFDQYVAKQTVVSILSNSISGF